MPRRFLKRHMPKPGQIKQVRSLRLLGDWIYEPNLWHLTRVSTRGAFFIGLFCAFLPLPTQMIFAALLAVWVKRNLPISVGLVWISNPLTMGPIFYGAYLVGSWLMGLDVTVASFSDQQGYSGDTLASIWQPLLLGCLVCGLTAGTLGYVSIDLLWRFEVARRWRRRKQRIRESLARRRHARSTPSVGPPQEQPRPPDEQETQRQENTTSN